MKMMEIKGEFYIPATFILEESVLSTHFARHSVGLKAIFNIVVIKL